MLPRGKRRDFYTRFYSSCKYPSPLNPKTCKLHLPPQAAPPLHRAGTSTISRLPASKFLATVPVQAHRDPLLTALNQNNFYAMNPEYHSPRAEENSSPNRQAQSGREARQRDGEPTLTDELTPPEQAEKEKAREAARAALATIYETLRQYPGKPSTREAGAAIDVTPLQELKPAYKQQLETAIMAEDPHRQDKQQFIDRGLEVLSLWIHLQGLKRGTDRELADLRAGIESI